MTPQEKAKELYQKYSFRWDINPDEIKQCALIAVDQIILANPHSNPFNTEVFSTMDYWVDVRKEIQKI